MSCFVVSLIPYIISPEWLLQQGIIPNIEQIELGLGALRAGIQFKIDNVEWLVDDKGLVVSSENEVVDCGDFAAGVISKLPHTPITAVGCDFNFTAGIGDWNQRRFPVLGTLRKEDFPNGWGSEAVRWGGTFRIDDSRIGITIAQAEDTVTISFNHHRVTQSSDQAVKAVQQFSSDRQRSKEMLSYLVDNGAN
jgi:hypothetical protein